MLEVPSRGSNISSSLLPHYYSSYQQSSSKDWLSPGAKQATSHPLLSKTQAKSSSAPQASQAWSVLQAPKCHPQHPAPQAIRIQQAGGGYGSVATRGDDRRHLCAEQVPVTSQTSKGGRSDKAASQDPNYTPWAKQFTTKPGVCNLSEVTDTLNPGIIWSKLSVAQFPP